MRQRQSACLDGSAETGRSASRAPRASNRIRNGLLGMVLGAVCAVPAMAQQLRVPPIADPASPEHHAGKIVFVELITPDIAASRQFYAGLFGWTFRDLQLGGTQYAEASLNGHTVAGLVHRPLPAGEHRQPAWLSFIAARDADATKATAVRHGAKVLFEPHDIPDRGREAVFADPQGAVFAILASSSGDPPDILAQPGEWIWSSLITGDPVAGAAFYRSLFDDEVFDLPAAKGYRHLMLATEGQARASVNSLPANRPDIHPYWLNFVRVGDTVAAVAKAVSLGGHVLVEPRVDRHGGKVAVIADPLGAPFGVMEWPAIQSKEVPE